MLATRMPERLPAQVADECEVFSMLDGDALERVVRKHQPDIIVPKLKAIRTERLYDFEKEGIRCSAQCTRRELYHEP